MLGCGVLGCWLWSCVLVWVASQTRSIASLGGGGSADVCGVGASLLASVLDGWYWGGIVIGHRVLFFHLQLGTSIEGTCRRLLSMAQLVIQQEQGQEPLQGGQVLRAPSKARGWHLRLVSQSWFPGVNESTSQNAFWVENENPRKRLQNKRLSGGALT